VAPVPEAALTPDLALEYLGELSADIRAAVLLDAAGALASCTEEEPAAQRMRDFAAELFERADQADDLEVTQVEVSTGGAMVFGVRGENWTLAVVAGRLALPSLMFFDIRHVLGDLGS
jgi:hypothetical protein